MLNKFYKAELPEFCGYGCFGYGAEPGIAMEACKQAYRYLKNQYEVSSDNEDYGNFKRAWEYFGGSLVEQVSEKWAIGGSENYIEIEKLNERR